MKLIFCKKCQDVRKLLFEAVICACGSSGGVYLDDGINATYWGEAVPLGFDNFSLARAIENQPNSGSGERFTAFVIPKKCPTYKSLD